MRKIIFTLFFLLSLVPTVKLHAQVAAGLSDEDIIVETTPDNPGTNSPVYIKLTSYITDINAANITWTINGVKKASGNGIRNLTVTTGDANSTTNIQIDIRTGEGQSVTKKISLTPIDVDLTWQSESYVPPFYKGKALFSHENKITFIALPHILNSAGLEIGPKNLVYKWSKDGSVSESNSGYGKNTFTFTGSVISRPLDVTVVVTSPNTNATGFARVTVQPVEPFVFFYEKNPVYGIKFEKALTGSLELTNSKELTVVGIPYYFGVKDPTSYDLTYKWSINGADTQNQNSNVQTFVKKEGTTGTAKISLSIESASKILQYTSNNFIIKFGTEETKNNIF